MAKPESSCAVQEEIDSLIDQLKNENSHSGRINKLLIVRSTKNCQNYKYQIELRGLLSNSVKEVRELCFIVSDYLSFDSHSTSVISLFHSIATTRVL